MLDKSFFVSTELQEREVELADGSKHVLYFKELPAIEFRRFALAEQSENENVKATSIAKLIAASLCDADGKLAITFSPRSSSTSFRVPARVEPSTCPDS
jgi:hypothetical protein